MSSSPRTIDVRPQQKLPLSKTFSLCINGVKHRILRSALTLAVVALAVAFFMFLQTETRLLQSVGRGAQTELEDLRFANRRLNLYTQNRRISGQSKVLAGQQFQNDPASWNEISAVTGWDVPRIKRLAQAAKQEQTYLNFFEDLPLGQRVILAGKTKSRQTLKVLADDGAWEEFLLNLEPMHNVSVPEGPDALRTVLDSYAAYLEELGAFNRAWNLTVSQVRDDLEALDAETALSESLASASPAKLAQVRELITRAGFKLTAPELEKIQSQLQTQEQLKTVSAALNRNTMMEAWKKTFQERNAPGLEEKLSRLDETKVQKLLADEFSKESLLDVQQYFLRSRELEKTLQALAGRIDLETASGIAGRQMFLLLISLMVCMVGITNAMLMSISERFREIATMKCLGATDPFILRQFMLEAGIQGAAGGLIGMGVGFLIAVGKTMISFGWDTFTNFPVGGVFLSALISFCCGVALSILASIYPSWAASRMAPMEAMRIE